ncbi:MAG TPA: transporter substrate-binding domain-containing protein [Pelagibacterium sp.]|uniref:transporter substrate-binding domain-containing protein n=1 Tax=Pelagibacterium sp. TaxID=1967288 RepID=UPI002C266467|nr:transporter substrate-binding domain-containing protein [Pelagibacterium sp.]HWJ88994.1 transporter substrate-binding domain-containing protein [Pelagibacterium sp.]
MPAFRAAIVAIIIGLAAFTGAGAQNLPVHVDPGARDDMLDAIAIPALRFLTTADFPPFNYSDAGGRLVGFNIDVADAICARLGARCTIQAWPWDRVQDALAENQGDALIAGLDMAGEAGSRFDFSRIYLQLPAKFVVSRANLPSFNPQNLAGTLAVREGSAHAQLAERMLPRTTIAGYDSEFAALDAVASGEADVYFGDGARAAFWLNDHPQCCDFVGESYFRPDLFGEGFAVAVPKGLDNVRVAINWALTRLQREGQLDEIYLRWFPLGFY